MKPYVTNVRRASHKPCWRRERLPVDTASAQTSPSGHHSRCLFAQVRSCSLHPAISLRVVSTEVRAVEKRRGYSIMNQMKPNPDSAAGRASARDTRRRSRGTMAQCSPIHALPEFPPGDVDHRRHNHVEEVVRGLRPVASVRSMLSLSGAVFLPESPVCQCFHCLEARRCPRERRFDSSSSPCQNPFGECLVSHPAWP